MPSFAPFRAWRYAPGIDLAAVTAPPYDVLSRADVARHKLQHPNNIVRLDVPPVNQAGYVAAAKNLGLWKKNGTLVRDDQPTLTLYRRHFVDSATGLDRTVIGVIGALEVRDEGSGGVLPHERVTPKASTDRLDLTRATQANLSAVWGLSLANGLTHVLDAIWKSITTKSDQPQPIVFVADEVKHEVLPVTQPNDIALVVALVSAHDVLIADGHHRYGVARLYRDEVRLAAEPSAAKNPAEATLAFVGELVENQLTVDAIHRLYDDVSVDDLLAALGRNFELSPGPAPAPELLAEMDRLGRLILVTPAGQTTWLTPRRGAFDKVRSLDSVWLEHSLANLTHVVSYQHGYQEIIKALPCHEAAILIRPTTVTEIRRTATQGLLMPPKSTFFTPKLQTGMVIRSLDD